jgi:hypothetical protein
MTLQPIATVCFWIAIATSAGAEQPPSATQVDSTRLLLDVNGELQLIERRSSEKREAGPSEFWQEETIRRPDPSGTLVLSERNVIHRSEANGSRQEVIETYVFDDEGFARSDGHLALHQRVRMSTTATSDGGRQTVEEVEGHNLAAYREPMRVIRRVVETVRQTGPDRWAIDRQVFELDLNGRLVPISTEREERTAR